MPTYLQNTGSSDLLPEGTYPFQVKNAEELRSKNDNAMIRLYLEVNGSVQVVDHLVFIDNAYWKIDQFRIATGEKLGAPNSKATLEAEDCIQRKGLVLIGVETWEGRDRNKVIEYLDSATNKVVETPKRQNVRPDLRREPKDIPF